MKSPISYLFLGLENGELKLSRYPNPQSDCLTPKGFRPPTIAELKKQKKEMEQELKKLNKILNKK